MHHVVTVLYDTEEQSATTVQRLVPFVHLAVAPRDRAPWESQLSDAPVRFVNLHPLLQERL